jgi:branched-chain amino acid transport system permease protein
MVEKALAAVQRVIFDRRILIAVVILLLFLPAVFYATDWCKEPGAAPPPLGDSACSFLVEGKFVTGAVLLSFTQMFVLIILASNWNLTGGFSGYIDFGHAVFFGLGAFGTAMLMGASPWERWPAALAGWSFWPAMVGGGVVAAVFAVLIGSATLRLKGPYFSIAMLGTLVAMREFVRVNSAISGGGLGLSLPIYLNRPLFYYLSLGLMLLVVNLIRWLRSTEFGATLIAIREDEIGAEMRGINTTLHKIMAFVIAAAFTGMVGGMWAYQNTFIDVNIVFNQNRTIDMVMMTMLGGLGTVAGPVIGSVVIYWLRDVVWANFLLYHQIFEGILLIVIVLFAPEGIMGLFGREKSGTGLSGVIRGWRRKSPQGSPTE